MWESGTLEAIRAVVIYRFHLSNRLRTGEIEKAEKYSDRKTRIFKMVLPRGIRDGKFSPIPLLNKEMKKGVDIGIYVSTVTLSHKLEQAEDGKGKEATWNMGRLPTRLGKGDKPDRLFFACEDFWRGYFLLEKEILYNPLDKVKPYSLIFNVTTWKEIPSKPVKRFRGFRYLEGMPD